jgi:type I restriction enzyme R subunit
MSRTSEQAFENAIANVLLASGYQRHFSQEFDRENAISPNEVLAFIQFTQPKVWEKLEIAHGDKTGDRIIAALCKWMDTNGSLSTLRHGFKCYGKTLRIAFFKPAHGLNPELEARYTDNILGFTRQLYFSPKNQQSLVSVLTAYH